MYRIDMGQRIGEEPATTITDITNLTDLELVSCACAGNETAFELLYQRHRRKVIALCSRMTHNFAEAEELAQETFLQVFRKLDTFRGESAFSTWLHRVASNVVLMKLRRYTPAEQPIEEWSIDNDEHSQGIRFGTEDMRLRGAVYRADLEFALRELAPGYRLVFILHDIEGYEHNEIAEMLGCTQGCSKSQLHKARLRLRQILAEQQQETPVTLAA